MQILLSKNKTFVDTVNETDFIRLTELISEYYERYKRKPKVVQFDKDGIKFVQIWESATRLKIWLKRARNNE